MRFRKYVLAFLVLVAFVCAGIFVLSSIEREKKIIFEAQHAPDQGTAIGQQDGSDKGNGNTSTEWKGPSQSEHSEAWATWETKPPLEPIQVDVAMIQKLAQNATERGLAYFAVRRYDEAIKHLEKALKEEPDMDDVIEFYLAWAYYSKDDYDSALKHFGEAVKSKYNRPQAIYMLRSSFSGKNGGASLPKEEHDELKKLEAEADPYSMWIWDLSERYYIEKRKEKGWINYGDWAPTMAHTGIPLPYFGANAGHISHAARIFYDMAMFEESVRYFNIFLNRIPPSSRHHPNCARYYSILADVYLEWAEITKDYQHYKDAAVYYAIALICAPAEYFDQVKDKLSKAREGMKDTKGRPAAQIAVKNNYDVTKTVEIAKLLDNAGLPDEVIHVEKIILSRTEPKDIPAELSIYTAHAYREYADILVKLQRIYGFEEGVQFRNEFVPLPETQRVLKEAIDRTEKLLQSGLLNEQEQKSIEQQLKRQKELYEYMKPEGEYIQKIRKQDETEKRLRREQDEKELQGETHSN